ncbi:MAG: ABC transporter permease [Bacteroidetes bacterium]|nr:ABC transporter permease [Bacteroidota bacterium]
MLSSFRPVEVLKGSNHSTSSGAAVRKTLVALQFAISIGLIAGTIVVKQQLDYMRSQELGFDQEQMLVVDMQEVPRSLTEGREDDILARFGALAPIRQATLSATIPGRGAGRNLFRTENLPDDDIRSAAVVNVGVDFFDTYGMQMVAGRGFDPTLETDLYDAIVVNETLVLSPPTEQPGDAIGQRIPMGGGGRTIIGVLGDYHHASLRDTIEPTLFFPTNRIMNYVSLRLAGQEAIPAVAAVEEVWNELFPDLAFASFFLDDDFNRQYQAEERLERIFTLFAGLAILIACLGLFGLSAFTAQQRTKEIGVRKVLGASIPSIVTLLSREFAVLVGVGLVLSIPAVSYGLDTWLDAFPYHIEVAWWVFLLSGVAALVIALLTVGYQALRVAAADPVHSLRYE